jgi:TPR repeat protein
MYRNGEGVPNDHVEAAKWFRKAAEQGLATAQCNLGQMYFNGYYLPIPKDEAEAVKWFRKAAEQGNAKAQKLLGDAYASAGGVPKDAVEAVKWYRKAAEQGDPSYQCNLAFVLEYGVDEIRNEAEAVDWYRKAADQGDAQGQINLAHIYYRGKYVPKNLTEAVNWYRKAAEQGDDLGQTRIAEMYSKGEGVPKNYIEAYKWWNIASASGELFAKSAAEKRDEIAKIMSPAQVAEAQRLAAAFVPKNTHNKSPNPKPSAAADNNTTPRFSGTGFFVTTDGYFLTSLHVVKEGERIVIQTQQGAYPARLVRADAANDVALLKVIGTFRSLPIAASRGVQLGETVFTIGFPNVQLQGLSPKLTKGEISSLTGAQDDPREFQISVAVQPGNSGGPLVNQSGNVVGLIEAQLSDKAAYAASGALPQNVNYAVKSSVLTVLLESLPELTTKLTKPNPPKERKFEDVVNETKEAVALVLVY